MGNFISIDEIKIIEKRENEKSESDSFCFVDWWDPSRCNADYSVNGPA